MTDGCSGASMEDKKGRIGSSPSATSPTDHAQCRTTITVNVDVSTSTWIVVRYESDDGQLFQGILLKSNDMTDPSSLAKYPHQTAKNSESRTRRDTTSDEHDGVGWRRQNFLASSSFSSSPAGPVVLAGVDLCKMSSVALRRTMSNGASKADADLIVANTKPALGIRRLENRSVRLRPTTSQRNTVLCAKCQEQFVYAPPARRAANYYNNNHNWNADRSKNGGGGGNTTSSNNFSGGDRIVNEATSASSTAACKRRPNDVATESRAASSSISSNNHNNIAAKKVKLRNGGGSSMAPAAEAGTATTAALPSASKVSGTPQQRDQSNLDKKRRNSNTASSSSSEMKNSTPPPKLPKLKISFGNNEEKTTTIITLPQTYSDDIEIDGGAGSGPTATAAIAPKNGCTIAGNGGGHEHEEGQLLPGGFSIGDVVWAKMPSAPYWPARIFSANNQAACVTWCGSKQYGFVEFKAMEPFKETFHKRYNAKRTNNNYQKAVAEAIIKCSGGDGDNSMDSHSAAAADSYYYQHIVSGLCWKYLTGAKSGGSGTPVSSNSKRRGSTAGKNNSSSRRKNNKAAAASRRNACSSKVFNNHNNHNISRLSTTSVDGLDAESVTTSFSSSMSSPCSNSFSDWQPRVAIRTTDQIAAEKRRLELSGITETKDSSSSSSRRQQQKVGGSSRRKRTYVGTRNYNPPTTSTTAKPAGPFSTMSGEIRPLSPLPVEKSDVDDQDVDVDVEKDDVDEVQPEQDVDVEEEDDDDYQDFKPLQIDEAANLEEEDDDEDELENPGNDGNDQQQKSQSCRADDDNVASAVSISPAGNGTYRLIPITTANDNEKTAAVVVRHQQQQQEKSNQQQSSHAATAVATQPAPASGQQRANNNRGGAGTGVGEGQDDFESALSELQEMNEMCASTSVLAQC